MAAPSEPVAIYNESRRFQLDFALIDCICSVIFCLLVARRCSTLSCESWVAWLPFRSSMYFGAFALFSDYFVYYLLQGSRTVDYPNDDIPMTSVETFFFFFWFDWINGAVIVLWALLVCEDLLVDHVSQPKDKSPPILMLIAVPMWFWATPWLSRGIDWDNRMLLVNRPSEKKKYWILMALFLSIMVVYFRMKISDVLRVFISGVGCGLIHHAPLFASGMRGYSSPISLIVTLLTEWPSIMCGLFVLTRFLASQKSKWVGRSLMVVLVATILAGNDQSASGKPRFSVRQAYYEIMPMVNADTLQTLGTAYVSSTSCWLPRFSTPVSCFEEDQMEPFWVVVAGAKGGAVVTAQMTYDIAYTCGRCIGAAVNRTITPWPGFESLPSYDSDVLLAIANMTSWKTYVEQQLSRTKYKGTKPLCIVITRDPFERLRSLYFYTREGRERLFRIIGLDKKLKEIHQHDSLQASVKYFVDYYQHFITTGHQYLRSAIQFGCHQIKFEDLVSNFNKTLLEWFDAWNIKNISSVRQKLLAVLAHHNPAVNMLPSSGNHHATGHLYSPKMRSDVLHTLASNASLKDTLKSHQRELNYPEFDAN